MDEARNCDRIGLMHHGKLIAGGTPKEVIEMAGASDLEEAFLKIAYPSGRREVP